MPQIKFAALLAGLLEFSLGFISWFSNLDNIKSTIVFIMFVCMSGYRFYRWTITTEQNRIAKDIRNRRDWLEMQNEKIAMIERAKKAGVEPPVLDW